MYNETVASEIGNIYVFVGYAQYFVVQEMQ